MPLTMKDIAKDLGLAESTISRVINGKGRVSQATRTRILEHIARVKYRPNEAARHLKLQTSSILGVIVPDSTNTYYSQLLKRIEADASRKKYSIILCNCDEKIEKEDQYVDFLLSNRVAGMIVATIGSRAWRRIDEEFLRRVVFVDNLPRTDRPYDSVVSDNYQAAYELTLRLIELGHERIATLTGPLVESTAAERLRGYRSCLRDNRIPFDPNLVVHTNFLFDDGHDKADVLLGEHPDITAILAQNNMLAYGVWRTAAERGIHVPEQLSVSCFDHIDPYGFMHPDFTAMQQPVEQIGQQAVDLLLRKIAPNGDAPNGQQTIVLPTRFHAGKTTAGRRAPAPKKPRTRV